MYQMADVIGSTFSETKETFEVLNPATGKSFFSCPLTSLKQIDDTLIAAKKAQPAFGALSQKERKEMLNLCAKAIEENASEIAKTLTLEQGKPLKDASREVKGAASYFAFIAGQNIEDEIIEDTEKGHIRITHKPYGLVAAISAWNFPISLAAWKIAPALLTGNGVVIKPSPDTPLSTITLVNILSEVLPKGILGVVTGHQKEGNHLVTHPLVDKVSFTGSVATGKKINEAVSSHLKRITLELGGNDAAIVLKDCNVEKTAKGIFRGAFVNNGQTCIAIKRVYVHEEIHDALIEEVVKIAKATKIGDGMADDTVLGPLCNQRQRDIVEGLVLEAKKNGARIHAGGQRGELEGFFYEPTIVSGVKEGDAIVETEQFGPALPFISFKEEKDAIRQANAVSVGLGGSIWTQDIEKGKELLGQLECGTAWLNQHVAIDLRAPFGGAKDSGIGVEHGKEGLLAFTQKQVLNMRC